MMKLSIYFYANVEFISKTLKIAHKYIINNHINYMIVKLKLNEFLSLTLKRILSICMIYYTYLSLRF